MTNKKLQLYWDQMAMNDISFHADFTENLFCELVPKASNILDIGCGYGRILNTLLEYGYTQLIGTDISFEMLKKSMQLHTDLKLIHHGDVILPFSDASFDAVILSSVLGCITENTKQNLLIKEIARVLKKNGVVYISDFYINDDLKNITRYNTFKNTIEQPYGIFTLAEGVPQRHHSPQYIKELLSIFKAELFESRIFQTMSGDKSKGFVYLGCKN